MELNVWEVVKKVKLLVESTTKGMLHSSCFTRVFKNPHATLQKPKLEMAEDTFYGYGFR